MIGVGWRTALAPLSSSRAIRPLLSSTPSRILGTMIEKLVTDAQVSDAVEALGLDLEREVFTREELAQAMEVEMEHGPDAGPLDLTVRDPLAPAKIAVVHLRMCRDYYRRLEEMRVGALLEEAARAVMDEPGTGMVYSRPPCRPEASAHSR